MNMIHSTFANAALFRAENGDVVRAEQLLNKSIEIADSKGTADDRFFARIYLAQFLVDAGRDQAAEIVYKSAITTAARQTLNMRHSLALRELAEVVERLGRPNEALALEQLAWKTFESSSDDACQQAVSINVSVAS